MALVRGIYQYHHDSHIRIDNNVSQFQRTRVCLFKTHQLFKSAGPKNGKQSAKTPHVHRERERDTRRQKCTHSLYMSSVVPYFYKPLALHATPLTAFRLPGPASHFSTTPRHVKRTKTSDTHTHH